MVATRTGSLAELVAPDSGILVPQRNPELLAAALGRLLEDGELRRRLGQAGRRHTLATFATEATTQQLLQLLGALPAAAPGPSFAAPVGPWAQGEGSVGALAPSKEAVF